MKFRNGKLASVLVLGLVTTVVATKLAGCGAQPATREQDQPPLTTPAPAPAPTPAPTPTPTPGPKPSCDTVTTFAQLQPIISLNCAGCHNGFDAIDKQRTGKTGAGDPLFPEEVRRIKLDVSDAHHMPAQRPSLAAQDIATFDNWGKDGMLAATDCTGATGTPGTPQDTFISFPTFEQAVFADVNKVSAADQHNTRWLVAQDQVILGNAAGVTQAKQAGDKGMNSVSSKTLMEVSQKVAPGVWRINIDDLGISAAQWKQIEDASLFQFESFTQTGLAIKSATQSRLPWLPVGEFNDIVLRNADVYDNLTHAPATVQQLEANLGVDFAGDLAGQKADLIGFNHSSLSPAANRLMARFDSNAGVFWATFDTGPIVSQQQSLFANPLLAEAGGQHNLKFAAGEQIYSLANGMHGYFLADAAGNRLNQADPAVVHDYTTNPLSPIIHNAISCFRCHNGGFVHATDQVRASVPKAGLGAGDTQIALALFKPQTTDDELFTADNAHYAAALKQIGVDPSAPDPIAQVSDRHLGDWTLEQLAAAVWQRPADLKNCISLSQLGSQQLAQLLQGATVSHDQFVQVSKQLQADCRLFQDPLAQ